MSYQGGEDQEDKDNNDKPSRATFICPSILCRRKREPDLKDKSGQKRVTFETTASEEAITRIKLKFTLRSDMDHSDSPLQGKPVSFDLSKSADVLAIGKRYKLMDIVATVIHSHSERTWADFLNIEKIKNFSFLYPAGYIFLPQSHLIIQRKGRTILIGRYQDSSRHLHWKPQIVFEIDTSDSWNSISAIGLRDEPLGYDIMWTANALNKRRWEGDHKDFDDTVAVMANELGEALLNCALQGIVPIVESS